jgi:hypothetical protein
MQVMTRKMKRVTTKPTMSYNQLQLDGSPSVAEYYKALEFRLSA